MPTVGVAGGTSVNDPCVTGFFSELLHGNALLCSQKQSLTENSEAQIQSVATNAATYYGADSATAQVAQQAADAQSMQASSDVNSIVDSIGNSSLFNPIVNVDCDGFDLSIVGGGCVNKWWIYGIATVIALFVLAPYILPFVGAFKRAE